MQHRSKKVVKPPKGAGKCPRPNSRLRMQYRRCNTFACPRPSAKETVKCVAKLDVVLLIDGSGSLGRKGWEASVKAATLMVGAFVSDKADSQLPVLLYSGP